MSQNIPSATIGLARANHVGIVVSDLDAAIRFYQALTGTTIANKDVIGGPRMAGASTRSSSAMRMSNSTILISIFSLQYDEPPS